MTRKEFISAFGAWVLAINEKIELDDPYQSFQDLARQYGSRTTNREDLEVVSECFNWGEIEKQLKGLK